MGILLFLLSFIFGGCLLWLMPLRVYKAEALAMLSVIGLLGLSWLLFLTAVFLPYTTSIPLTLILMAAMSGLIFYKKDWHRLELIPSWLPTRKGIIGWVMMTILVGALLSYFLYTHMLQVKADGWYSAGGSWGDMGFHLTLLSHFASQTQLSLDFPLLAGNKLTYPFLIDLLSSVFFRLGWSVQLAFIMPGLVLALSLVQLIFFLSYRLFGRVEAAIISIFLFLCNGAFGGIFYFFKDWSKSGESFILFLRHLPHDYSNWDEQSLHFTNILITHLLPQRSILFGFSIFVLVLILFFELYKTTLKQGGILWYIAAILTALTPFAHAHTFLVLVCAWVLFLGCYTLRHKIIPQSVWWSGMFLLLFALPQIWWQLNGIASEGYGHFYLGWLRGKSENVFYFWLLNFGLLIPFLLLTGFFLKKYKKTELGFSYYLYGLSGLLFLATNLYIFQPNPYDNLKIMSEGYLILCLFIGFFLFKWNQINRFVRLGVYLIIVLIMLPGGLSIVRETQQSYLLISDKDQKFATDLQSIIPSDAIVLASDNHNHPISAVLGRTVVMGYRGWLWSYGIDYSQREKDVTTMLQGELNAPELLEKYKVSYVVIGLPELYQWQANQTYFENTFPTVYQSDKWKVFKVR